MTSSEPAGETTGRVDISDRVLERIATQALGEVDEVGGVARRVLGVPLGQGGTDTAPQVDARVDGNLATLKISMSVVYPAPVRRVAGKVRDLVSSRVGEFTGLEVRQVDVDVATLVSTGSSPRRVS